MTKEFTIKPEDKDSRHVYINRREFLKKAGKVSLSLAGVPIIASLACSSENKGNDSAEKANGENNNTNNDTSPTNGPLDNAVYIVKNGDCFQNIKKLFEMMGGIKTIINEGDVVVIKGNGQWPNQGYTHTGCIKAVIDEIFLAYPAFSGEIFICDNIQAYDNAGQNGFDSTSGYRTRNWIDHNWDSLALYYRGLSKKVTSRRWLNNTDSTVITGPANLAAGADGWIREYFTFHGSQAYLSYPLFRSELVTDRIIDMKNGVWEGGAGGGYSGRKVKTIFMPTLNNHGYSVSDEDYAGVTSAIKSFFGATEAHNSVGGSFNGYKNIHNASYDTGGTANGAYYAGELAARFIKNQYKPNLYITAAMFTGHASRTGDATETKTVLACTNPATLDYVACRDVMGPLNPKLNPAILNGDSTFNRTRKQIEGCIYGGIGTITEGEYSVRTYSF